MSSRPPPSSDDMWESDDAGTTDPHGREVPEESHTVHAEGWPTITIPTRSTRDAPPATVESPPPEGDDGQRDTAVDVHRPGDANSRTPAKTRSKIRSRILVALGLLTIGSAAITGVIHYKRPRSTADHTSLQKKSAEKSSDSTKTQPRQKESAEKLPDSIKIQIEVKADYGRLAVVKIQAVDVPEAVQRQIKYLAFLPDGEASTNSSGELEQRGKLLVTTQDRTTTTYTLDKPLTALFDGSGKTIEVTATIAK